MRSVAIPFSSKDRFHLRTLNFVGDCLARQFIKAIMMIIAEAQREMRRAFKGGFVGQLVAGVIWMLSAAISTWVNARYGMAVLFFGSMLLFPLTQIILRWMGRPAALQAGNTLGQLATQIAFTVPINFVLVAVATLYRETWFYPASMVVVGAHYLPFTFLYGMRHFAVLAGLMILGGVSIALYASGMFSLGGWLVAALLMVFAVIGRNAALNEERRSVR
jgi:hypothetical protein